MNRSSTLPQHSLHWLIFAGLATVILWQIPGADLILYPFAILATWFQEMGHGLAALLMGGDFQTLALNADGSGVATYTYIPGMFAAFGQAFIAASGPLGPALAGALFIMSGKKSRTAGVALGILAGILFLSAALWVRTSFGIIAVTALGVMILALAIKGSAPLRAFSIQFLGIQACISTYKQVDYLFMGEAEIGGTIMVSDTMQIANQLLLPHWFWGGLIIALSLSMLIFALWFSYRDVSREKRPKMLYT